jgi:hypothetical protein
MSTGKPSHLLIRFVENILHSSADKERQPTVRDLPVEIRAERLTEFSNWSCRDLDLIEQECTLHGHDTPLAVLVSDQLHIAS